MLKRSNITMKDVKESDRQSANAIRKKYVDWNLPMEDSSWSAFPHRPTDDPTDGHTHIVASSQLEIETLIVIVFLVQLSWSSSPTRKLLAQSYCPVRIW